MKKFSILLLIYNAKLEKILYTLKSVLEQKMNAYEVIICDDCSKNDYTHEIENMLRSYQFNEYHIVRNQENVGTVKNIHNGLRYAKGKYIKLIGAGDLLFNMNTLEDVYDFMEKKQCECCFGYMQGFSWNNGVIKENDFLVPRDLSVYENENKREKYLVRNITVYEDWVSGASMFMSRKYLSKYISMLVNRVYIYEDWLQALGILDGYYFQLFDKYTIWYEMGEGISTNPNGERDIRLKQDSQAFWKIYDEYYEKKNITSYKKENKKRYRKKKCDEIKNYRLKMICKGLSNIDMLFFMLKNKKERNENIKLKRNEKGFLDDKNFIQIEQ